MRYFYIDTENVKSYEFIDNWNLSKDDTIVFFVSENSRSIKFNELSKFLSLSSKTIFENVVSKEKNAMDFHMVASLATNIVLLDKHIEHYIVSDDNGFYTAINYLQTKHNDVEIFVIKPDVDKSAFSLLNSSEGLNDLNCKMNKKFGHDICYKIYPTYRHLFTNNKIQKELEERKQIEETLFLKNACDYSKNLRDFRNSLRSQFGNSKGSELHLKYKEYFLECKSNKNNDLLSNCFDVSDLIVEEEPDILIKMEDILADDNINYINIESDDEDIAGDIIGYDFLNLSFEDGKPIL